jgi:predicted DNA-binding WGR domain protein
MTSKQVHPTNGTLDRGVSTLLHRIDPARNEARFYFVIVGSSLFDSYAVMRVWGRIGGHQRAMITPCRNAAEACTLAARLIRRRLKHGYQLVQGELPENITQMAQLDE